MRDAVWWCKGGRDLGATTEYTHVRVANSMRSVAWRDLVLSDSSVRACKESMHTPYLVLGTSLSRF
jgi:hypothetical protein